MKLRIIAIALLPCAWTAGPARAHIQRRAPPSAQEAAEWEKPLGDFIDYTKSIHPNQPIRFLGEAEYRKASAQVNKASQVAIDATRKSDLPMDQAMNALHGHLRGRFKIAHASGLSASAKGERLKALDAKHRWMPALLPHLHEHMQDGPARLPYAWAKQAVQQNPKLRSIAASDPWKETLKEHLDRPQVESLPGRHTSGHADSKVVVPEPPAKLPGSDHPLLHSHLR